ncbi:ABC-three component system protein [Streptomyces sp. NRRL F-2664]|uniref:ABC-three component system protein n=1 Tax=Streptomyces sp. NRRL F-2664 TaxID=1463842 RepID=UPI00131DB606|nr:ABC-three component system protein [Streptomyces sp. NRRL F-2664]
MADYSANESMLGYLYQARYALHAALSRMEAGSSANVRIEQLDDVSFDAPGTPTELLQLKYHTDPSTTLPNASADVWKTLRVWLDQGDGYSFSGESPVSRYLITTGRAAKGSATYYLRDHDRDVSKALEILTKTAQTSENKEQQDVYRMFLGLIPEERLALVSTLIVVDSEPLLEDLELDLQKKLYFAASSDKRPAFLRRLEGWWFQRCVQHLRHKVAPPITVGEIQEELELIREEFRRDNLPINPEVFDIVEEEASRRDFVRQLQLISVTGPRLAGAVSSYIRAFAQRSEWVRDDLLTPGELSRYEERLKEAWGVRFWESREELGESAAEAEKVKMARALYKWVEQEADIRIREMCRESFVMQGTYHGLADRLDVGWHPDFEARLAALLEGEPA